MNAQPRYKWRFSSEDTSLVRVVICCSCGFGLKGQEHFLPASFDYISQARKRLPDDVLYILVDIFA